MFPLALLFALALAIIMALLTYITARSLTHPKRRTFAYAIANNLPADPDDLQTDYQTVILNLDNAPSIELWDIAGQSSNPTSPSSTSPAPIILILHGYGQSRINALQYLDALNPIAHRILIFDQRGHGESSARTCTWGVHEPQDTIAILNWAKSQYPNHPRIVLGCSMGADYALRAATQAPADLIQALILDSPYRHIRDVVRRKLVADHLPTWPNVPIALAWLALKAPALRTRDTLQIAPHIKFPALIMHGRDDTIIPHQHANQLAQVLNASFVLFDDTQHLQAAQNNPALYQQHISEFLNNFNLG